MKVVAFNSSPRKDGNTFTLLQEVLKTLESEGIETELIQIGGLPVHGCTACRMCGTLKDGTCVINDDMNGWIKKMIEADGIIMGSPTYFADITPELKALIDRAGIVSRSCGNLFARKVGAAVAAVRRCGSIHAIDSINHFFLIGEMIIPGSSYWNLGVGGAKGAVEEDEEGMNTMRKLGENMAWLLKKIQ